METETNLEAALTLSVIRALPQQVFVSIYYVQGIVWHQGQSVKETKENMPVLLKPAF